MPKPRLAPQMELLEREMIRTAVAGLKEWRPDLNYPESHSDMQGCMRALLRRFDIAFRPTDRELVFEDSEVSSQ